MEPSAPQIGFDRFIPLEFAAAALRVRADFGTGEELSELLDSAGLGTAARKKTQTVLNRLWLEPRPQLADFADRGVAIFKADPSAPVVALSWGMAVATYPFFGKVAELVGRLSALQGSCASTEVHRRMSEVYGEREGTYRMTNMVLQSQANWGAIERTEKNKRFVRKTPIVVRSDRAVAWIIEAALRYAGKALPIPAFQSLPVLYPFVLDQPIAYLASTSRHLDLRSEGSHRQLVALRN